MITIFRNESELRHKIIFGMGFRDDGAILRSFCAFLRGAPGERFETSGPDEFQNKVRKEPLEASTRCFPGFPRSPVPHCSLPTYVSVPKRMAFQLFSVPASGAWEKAF